jgi:hypothetical protein
VAVRRRPETNLGWAAVMSTFATFCLRISGDMTAGELLVGVGTLALAAFTAWLAARTSAEVKVSEEQIRLSREGIEALDRPFIIASPDEEHSLLGFAEVGPQHAGWRFVYRLWNIGKGPAIVENMSLVDASTQREYLTSNEKMERPVAMQPPVYDGLSQLVSNSPPGAGAELILRITYRSASGTRYVTSSRVQVTGNLSCICTDFQREEQVLGSPP